MFIKLPYPFRMLVLMVALFQAFISISASGQDISPIVDDRVESEIVNNPEVYQDRVKRPGWDLGAVISAAYDDNIFLARENAKADHVYRIGPVISYAKGDATEGEGGFARLAYNPTAVFYSKNSAENRIDHQAAWTAGWRGKATVITYEGGVRKTADATADAGRKTDRLETANSLRVAWTPREKVTTELAVGHAKTDYKDPSLFDSKNIYGEAVWKYAYSPKTTAGLAYRATYLSVDGSDRQLAHQVTGRLNWKPREKIAIQLEAGAEDRKTSNGSEINPVLEGRIEWQARENTSLYVTAYQREVASSYLAGQNYRLTGFTAGIAQKMGLKWTARLEGGHENASYRQVSGAGDGNREDRMWFIKPSLEYKISEKVDVQAFYRTSKSNSTSEDLGYDQNLTGLQLNYQF